MMIDTPVTVCFLYLKIKQFRKSTSRHLQKKLWRLQCCSVNSARATLCIY